MAQGPEAAPSEVRREAARALGRIGSPDAVASLAAALDDVDPGVRTAAAESLRKLAPQLGGLLGPDGCPFDAAAFGLPPDRFGDPEFASSADAAWTAQLSRWVAERDVAALIAATQGPRRAQAIGALGEVGGDEAVAFLQGLALGDVGDETSRKAAYRAYKRAQRRSAHRHRTGAELSGDRSLVAEASR